MNQYFITVIQGLGDARKGHEYYRVASSPRVAINSLLTYNLEFDKLAYNHLASVQFDIVNQGRVVEVCQTEWRDDWAPHQGRAMEHLVAINRKYILATESIPGGWVQYRRKDFVGKRREKATGQPDPLTGSLCNKCESGYDADGYKKVGVG